MKLRNIKDSLGDPSDPLNPLNSLNPSNPPSPLHLPNPCPHPPIPCFKDSPSIYHRMLGGRKDPKW